MVRFIIRFYIEQFIDGTWIYIPLWLDLLCYIKLKYDKRREYLHSTMVRFIIAGDIIATTKRIKFTFHYG